jgi:hypothetical protein
MIKIEQDTVIINIKYEWMCSTNTYNFPFLNTKNDLENLITEECIEYTARWYHAIYDYGKILWKIMITEKNHKLLTSQIFVTDCTKKGLASMPIS